MLGRWTSAIRVSSRPGGLAIVWPIGYLSECACTCALRCDNCKSSQCIRQVCKIRFCCEEADMPPGALDTNEFRIYSRVAAVRQCQVRVSPCLVA